jgi:hydroxypyruvate isomerase
MTTRRNAIKNIALGATAALISPACSSAAKNNKLPENNKHSKNNQALKGKINHSVCRWTFNQLSVEELCKGIKDIGFSAMDLVGPKDWPILQQYGIFSSMCYTDGANSLTKGWNHTEYHEKLIQDFTATIPLVAKAGYKNLICFSGNRDGMDDETGLKNCVAGLQKIIPLAEKNGVIVQMELLNSKVDHKDYMCDHTNWGVELCKRLNSENFKLLYDIYHMQIDEGDVIRTIQDYHQYIGHYHTGGVPGRHEIDESQELYYPAIMRAILKTGFTDYVAQEFLPAKEDKLESLRQAVHICDVELA